MIGWWQGFPYWTTVAVCAIGGILGVMFSVPLRRALVTGSDLPYPEGVAAAEVLKVGFGLERGRRGECQGPAPPSSSARGRLGRLRVARGDEARGGEVATAFRLGGGAASGASTSLSLALIGVGHLVGMRSASPCWSAC